MVVAGAHSWLRTADEIAQIIPQGRRLDLRFFRESESRGKVLHGDKALSRCLKVPDPLAAARESARDGSSVAPLNAHPGAQDLVECPLSGHPTSRPEGIRFCVRNHILESKPPPPQCNQLHRSHPCSYMQCHEKRARLVDSGGQPRAGLCARSTKDATRRATLPALRSISHCQKTSIFHPSLLSSDSLRRSRSRLALNFARQ
ncbi:MAG: hypothetical protein KatS3mg109_1771 [Pirellulaceae bacterium]|nr:MAG: hypothetical protein KatS3mg109_1771 [Pirellulaceae bacterium]